MSTGENPKGHSSFPGALENHTCIDSRPEDEVLGPTALAVSSDSDVESAIKRESTEGERLRAGQKAHPGHVLKESCTEGRLPGG